MDKEFVSLSKFGDIVKERRESLDWTVERLAIEIGRSKRTIQYIERGNHSPCKRTIGQLIKIWPYLENTQKTNDTIC